MINVSESTFHLRGELQRVSSELAVAKSVAMTAYKENPEIHLDRERYFALTCKVNDLSSQLIKVRKAFADSILADMADQERL